MVWSDDLDGFGSDVVAVSMSLLMPQFPQEEFEDLDKEPFVDKDKELEQRRDGMWYKINGGELYTGIGVTFYANGPRKSRTKFVDGLAIGLIEEWDMNGTLLGPRFKGEFKP